MDPAPIVDDLRPLLKALALRGIPPQQLAGVLTGVAFVMLTLRNRWPEITRTMEGPGPAAG